MLIYVNGKDIEAALSDEEMLDSELSKLVHIPHNEADALLECKIGLAIALAKENHFDRDVYMIDFDVKENEINTIYYAEHKHFKYFVKEVFNNG